MQKAFCLNTYEAIWGLNNDLIVAVNARVRASISAGGDGLKCSVTEQLRVFWVVLSGFPCWRNEDEL